MSSRAFPLKLCPCEFQKTFEMMSQDRPRWWLGPVRPQAITWANVDQVLRGDMASPGTNVLSFIWNKYMYKYTTKE